MAILRAVLVIEHDAPSGGSSISTAIYGRWQFQSANRLLMDEGPIALLLVPPLRAWKAEDLYYAPAELLSD